MARDASAGWRQEYDHQGVAAPDEEPYPEGEQ